ncbi:hypothetical protein H6F52_18980 [Coleofasciculus sp. FACHB-542]|nr:hypothetical protein [Coleofasciculus sp. FACHB-542]
MPKEGAIASTINTLTQPKLSLHPENKWGKRSQSTDFFSRTPTLEKWMLLLNLFCVKRFPAFSGTLLLKLKCCLGFPSSERRFA